MTTTDLAAAEALGQDASAAFAAWLERRGLLGKIDKAQCEAMAECFVSGYVRGAAREVAAGDVTVSREDIRAVVRLARLSRHVAEDPATDRLAEAAGEGATP